MDGPFGFSIAENNSVVDICLRRPSSTKQETLFREIQCDMSKTSKSIVIGDISKITFQYQTPCNTVCNLLLEKLSQLIK